MAALAKSIQSTLARRHLIPAEVRDAFLFLSLQLSREMFMSKLKFTFVTAAALLLFAVAPIALAQTETGQIVGKVIDPNGAAVAGAAVSIKSVETGREVTATSNDEGVYTVTNLQPGIYDVTVQSGSFKPNTQRVKVTVGAKLSVDTQLALTEIAAGNINTTPGAGEGIISDKTENSGAGVGAPSLQFASFEWRTVPT